MRTTQPSSLLLSRLNNWAWGTWLHVFVCPICRPEVSAMTSLIEARA